jgi:hypothetical protein
MKQMLKLLPVLLTVVLLAGCTAMPLSVPSMLGYTPLQTAIYNNDQAKVRQLLDSGADVREKDKYGSDALMVAAGYGRTEIMKLLLDAGADINRDLNGYSAIKTAAYNNHAETVGLLLDRGATDGGGALLMAAQRGHAETVRLLLSKGIDVNTKNTQGTSALDLARENGKTAVVNLIQSTMNQQMVAQLNSATLTQLLAQNNFSSEVLIGMLTDKLIEAKNRDLPGLIATSSLDRRIALVTTVEKRLAEAQTTIVELTGRAEDAVRKGQDSSGYRRHIGKLQAYMAVLAEMKNMLMQS